MVRDHLWTSGWCGLAWSTLACVALAGCGGTGFSGEIRVPLEQKHTLVTGSQTPDQVRLPGDRVFNVHSKSSNQTPGPQGDARGDSDATPDGQAFCSATASNGGTAHGEFMIGHRVDNETGRRLGVTIQIDFELQQELNAPRVPAQKTLATANLTLTVLDGRNHPLASIPLVQTTSDLAAGTATTTTRHNLSVIFDPQQSYSMMLRGEVNSETAVGQEASSRLQIRNLHMRLTFTPAPPDSAPAGPGSTQPAN